MNANWYVFYLCPRAEKKVRDLLIMNGYMTFLPTIKTRSIWKNRQKKVIEIPAFPGYIFIYIAENELYNIVRMPRIVTFVHVAGKPSTLSNDEIERLQQIFELGENISIENQLLIGDKVTILAGPFADFKGTLVKRQGKWKFGIQLAEINFSVLIDINTTKITKTS
jgi:transcription antitermination factor NusG